jgi:site-specific DNA-methyltransferase (adenine-specific)
VALFEYLIRTYTNPGELVLDSCMGSGTTAVACIRSGRKYTGFETDPEYYKTAIERTKNASPGAEAV